MGNQTNDRLEGLILLLEDFKEKHFRVKLALFKRLKTYCENMGLYIKQERDMALLKEQLDTLLQVLRNESMNLEVLRLAIVKNERPAPHTFDNIVQFRNYENRAFHAVWILFEPFSGISISFNGRKRKKVIIKILEKYSGISYGSYEQLKHIAKKIQEHFR